MSILKYGSPSGYRNYPEPPSVSKGQSVAQKTVGSRRYTYFYDKEGNLTEVTAYPMISQGIPATPTASTPIYQWKFEGGQVYYYERYKGMKHSGSGRVVHSGSISLGATTSSDIYESKSGEKIEVNTSGGRTTVTTYDSSGKKIKSEVTTAEGAASAVESFRSERGESPLSSSLVESELQAPEYAPVPYSQEYYSGLTPQKQLELHYKGETIFVPTDYPSAQKKALVGAGAIVVTTPGVTSELMLREPERAEARMERYATELGKEELRYEQEYGISKSEFAKLSGLGRFGFYISAGLCGGAEIVSAGLGGGAEIVERSITGGLLTIPAIGAGFGSLEKFQTELSELSTKPLFGSAGAGWIFGQAVKGVTTFAISASLWAAGPGKVLAAAQFGSAILKPVSKRQQLKAYGGGTIKMAKEEPGELIGSIAGPLAGGWLTTKGLGFKGPIETKLETTYVKYKIKTEYKKWFESELAKLPKGKQAEFKTLYEHIPRGVEVPAKEIRFGEVESLTPEAAKALEKWIKGSAVKTLDTSRQEIPLTDIGTIKNVEVRPVEYAKILANKELIGEFKLVESEQYAKWFPDIKKGELGRTITIGNHFTEGIYINVGEIRNIPEGAASYGMVGITRGTEQVTAHELFHYKHPRFGETLTVIQEALWKKGILKFKVPEYTIIEQGQIKELVIGGTTGMRTQVYGEKYLSNLKLPGDVDIYSRTIAPRYVISDIIEFFEEQGVKGYYVKKGAIWGPKGKAIEVHPVYPEPGKVDLATTISKVAEPYKSFESLLTKTPSGVQVPKVQYQLLRKLYGAFEPSPKTGRPMERYTKDILAVKPTSEALLKSGIKQTKTSAFPFISRIKRAGLETKLAFFESRKGVYYGVQKISLAKLRPTAPRLILYGIGGLATYPPAPREYKPSQIYKAFYYPTKPSQYAGAYPKPVKAPSAKYPKGISKAAPYPSAYPKAPAKTPTRILPASAYPTAAAKPQRVGFFKKYAPPVKLPKVTIVSPEAAQRKKVQRQTRTYDVYVRESAPKGKAPIKWVKVNRNPLPKNKAMNMGAYYADNTSADTFRLKFKRTQRGVVEDDSSVPLLYKFRGKAPGSKIKGAPSFIEKNKYRIDSMGERQGITAKGLLAQQYGSARRSKMSIKPAPKYTVSLRGGAKEGNFLADVLSGSLARSKRINIKGRLI